MENFTPNGVSRTGMSFPVGNGYKDRNGGSTLSGGPSQQIRDSMSVENITKSRSNEWYMLSPSSGEPNNNCYCKDMRFPKSVTSSILAPDQFPSYFGSRALHGPATPSGRWPNSIEDPERETTRSSSNPAISTSVSDEFSRKTDCSSKVSSQDEKLEDLFANEEENCHAGLPTKPTDSLPKHRKRLSRSKKRSLHLKRADTSAFDPTDGVTNYRDSPDSSYLMSCYDDNRLGTPIQKELPSATLPTRRRRFGVFAKRPKDLKFCDEHGTNSMENVGSWLANHSFDWIDSSHTTMNTPSTRGSIERWQSREGFMRRTDEIFFGTPTQRDVTFNVSGQHYRIDPNILARFPDTLLGSQERRAKFWDPFREEYFLDRHRATFEVIIEYYINNGILSRPDDIPIDIFIHEVKFYCLDRENLHQFLSAEGILLVVKKKPMPVGKVKQFIWNLFEDPESCLIARIVTTLSALVIAVSVVVFCMETVPAFKSLGESSLENIEPTVLGCERALFNKTDLFQPIGDLFAEHDVPNEGREKRNAVPDSISDSTPTTGKATTRYQSLDIDGISSQSGGEKSMIDSFSSEVVIVTMQRTLAECASDERTDLLSKYTLLRCDEELRDAFIYSDETPIEQILSEVEVHDHDHEEEEKRESDVGVNEELDASRQSMKKVSYDDGSERKQRRFEDHVIDGKSVFVNLKNDDEEERTNGNSVRNVSVEAVTGNILENPTYDHNENGRRIIEKIQDDDESTHDLLDPISEYAHGRKSKRRKSNKSKKSPTFSIGKSRTRSSTHKKNNVKQRGNSARNATNSGHKQKMEKSFEVSNSGRTRRDLGETILETKAENVSYPKNDTEQRIAHLLTLNQTVRALQHVCSELDKHSIRSSYAWLVLEASLGGPAGQLFLIESSCIVWFVIEIVLRLYSCPNKYKFCTNFLNIIDAIAIMPYFITLIVTSLHTDSNLRPQTATILRTIRLVRMLRILKLSRHSRGLRILGLTLVRSTRVLVLLVCFQMVLAVTFSSIVYYVEYDAVDTMFKSIPGSFWWAIITMTTVGYGDVVPITTWGKITGAFCAIMGILGIAFPVPVIVSNFNYLYNLDSDDCKLTPEELMGDPEESDTNNNNMEKFQENLFDAVRRNVGSMTSGPQENQPTGQNPAELWNYARRQYHGSEKKPQKLQEQQGRHAKNKFTKGIVAMATASALTISLPESTTVHSRASEERRRKATSI